MTNPLRSLWRNLRLSEEEKAQTARARKAALEQQVLADRLSVTVTDMERRNNFGWKFHAAMRERPVR